MCVCVCVCDCVYVSVFTSGFVSVSVRLCLRLCVCVYARACPRLFVSLSTCLLILAFFLVYPSTFIHFPCAYFHVYHHLCVVLSHTYLSLCLYAWPME